MQRLQHLWDKSAHYQHLISSTAARWHRDEMVRATKVSFKLFIVCKVLRCVQRGRWWSLTELPPFFSSSSSFLFSFLLLLRPARIQRKARRFRGRCCDSLLCENLPTPQSWLMIREMSRYLEFQSVLTNACLHEPKWAVNILDVPIILDHSGLIKS